MKASELRVGNYIKYKDEILFIQDVSMFRGRYCSNLFKSVFDSFPKHYSQLLTSLKPIQLTEEWLDKFGFERGGYDLIEVWHPDNDRFSMVGYLDEENEDERYLGWNYNHNGTIDECDSSRIEIKHVHQLQNLYFALTGKELEIKELSV